MARGKKKPQAEWNAHKADLYAMYITEGNEAAEVIERARRELDFDVTKGQLLRQFEIWGLKKNATKAQWTAVLREVREREAEGKKTQVYIYNQLISQKRLHKEMSRYGKDSCEPSSSVVATPGSEVNEIDIDVQSQESDEKVPTEQSKSIRIGGDNTPRRRIRQNVARYPPSFEKCDSSSTSSTDEDELWFLDLLGSSTEAEYFSTGCGLALGASSESRIQANDFPFQDDSIYRNSAWNDEGSQKVPSSFFHVDFSQLLECMGASINLDSTKFWNTISHQQVDDKMHDQLMEPLKSRKSSPTWESLLPTIVYAISLSSNNLLSDSRTDKLVEWIYKAGKHQLFGYLMDFKAPWTQAVGSNFLVSAARLGYAEIVNTLLRKGVKVNIPIRGIVFKTALQEAVNYRHLRTVQILLDAGADPKSQPKASRSLLHDALSGPHNLEMVQALIDKGADVNGPFNNLRYSSSVLVSAARNRDIAMIRVLLKAGAQVDGTNQDTATALQFSVSRADTDAVLLLIDHGAKIDAPSGEDLSCMRQGAAKYGHLDHLKTPIQRASLADNTKLVEVLLQKGADVNVCPWEEFVDYMNWDERNYFQDGSLLTALQAAVVNQNAVLTRILLKAKAEVDARGCGDSPLTITAARGDTEMMRILLDHGANVNGPAGTHNGHTALQAAARRGDFEIVQQLLEAGANVNAAATHVGGRTALQASVASGDIKLIQVLIQAGANPNAGISVVAGRTCIQSAAEMGRQDVILLLLEAGAELKDPVSRKGISTITAAVKGKNKQLIQLLIRLGFSTNRNGHEKSPLGEAVAQQSLEIVSLLIAAGADVNDCCNTGEDYSSGETPLQVAASRGNLTIATRLLEAGARHETKFCRRESRTVLQCAVQADCASLVERLLNNDICLNEEYIDRSIALSQAVSRYRINIDIVRALINAGANVNYGTKSRQSTPLCSAAGAGNIELTQLLLEAGANVNATDHIGKSALVCAVQTRKLRLIQILLDAGADVNASPYEMLSPTALQEAANINDTNAVKFLLSRGADVNAPGTKSGVTTALQAAVINGNIGIVRILLKAGAKVFAPPASNRGIMALDAAAEYGRLDILLLLLESNDEIENLGTRCKRAASRAAKNGNDAIARLLMDHSAGLR